MKAFHNVIVFEGEQPYRVTFHAWKGGKVDASARVLSVARVKGKTGRGQSIYWLRLDSPRAQQLADAARTQLRGAGS